MVPARSNAWATRQLSAGDSLELESSEDQIVLRPVRGTAGLRKKQGIWVINVDEPLSVEALDRTIRDIRREREESWMRSKAAAPGSDPQ